MTMHQLSMVSSSLLLPPSMASPFAPLICISSSSSRRFSNSNSMASPFAPLICISSSSSSRRLSNSNSITRVRPITAISTTGTSLVSKESHPWLMLPPSFESGDTTYNFYSLTTKEVLNISVGGIAELRGLCGDTEVVGSSHGFLTLFHKRTHHLFLYNPISFRRIHLPPIHTLSLDDIGLGPLHMRVNKVVISDDETRAMMIYGPTNRLAFCCPGRSTKWTPLFDEKHEYYTKLAYRRTYRDIVYSKKDKLFTCATYNDEIEEWDLRLTRAQQHVYELEYNVSNYRPWLYDINEKMIDEETYVVFAEHSNQLYVVCRYIMKRSVYMKNIKQYIHFPNRGWDDYYPYKTIGFDVYKVGRMGDNTLQLNYMEGSLDNLIMFLGANHSFAVRAEDYLELKPDSIYFTHSQWHTPLDWQTYGGNDTGIYYFNDRTFCPLDYPYDVSTIKGIVSPPLWFTPSLH